MREADTAVNTLHSHGVLLIFIKAAENVEELSLGHTRNQLDHVVEDDSGLLAYLRDLVN